MTAAMTDYTEMVDLMESAQAIEIERLIELGIISSAAEFDPEADYRIDDYEEDIFGFGYDELRFDSYNDEDYF